jgi:hypothetical protein
MIVAHWINSVFGEGTQAPRQPVFKVFLAVMQAQKRRLFQTAFFFVCV